MPGLEDHRSALLEMNDIAEMLERVERRIIETLNRIEADLKDRQVRHERDDDNRHAALVSTTGEFEKRLRVLEDTKTKGSGAWWVLGGFLAIVASICCIVVANTALDEIRSVRQQLWTTQTIQGRKP